MITKVRLQNFKSIEDETYDFGAFDLIVGRNNSGKSTVLQALAIWQFCVDEFHHERRTGSSGIQITLPNFTALPLPEFNLLWRERTERRYPEIEGTTKRKQEFILIEIEVMWKSPDLSELTFGVQIRYGSPQSIYIKPKEGWTRFRELDQKNFLPRIAYVPPFSGLDTTEERRDDGPMRRQVGKAQPGSVLRNLLLRVDREETPPSETTSGNGYSNGKKRPPSKNWIELQSRVKDWFDVDLKQPEYELGRDTKILCEYTSHKRDYDIISAGSGFHQTLTLLAFLYGYNPTVILLDEPDAHLHVNLQRQILDYFKAVSAKNRVQFLIATHAEEFVKGVGIAQIISLLPPKPVRLLSTENILTAMADVTNLEMISAMASPFLVYVEGESDERVLRAWSKACGAEEALSKVQFSIMGGGNKKMMKENANRHFKGLQSIVPLVKRVMLFDYDSEESYHPDENNPTLYEWKRKNIENYLLVPDAWIRVVKSQLFEGDVNRVELFAVEELSHVANFFSSENLTLPAGQTWRDVKANIFKVVDGKQLLFESKDSLSRLLSERATNLKILREAVAMQMLPEEIHSDVHLFFAKIKKMTEIAETATTESKEEN